MLVFNFILMLLSLSNAINSQKNLHFIYLLILETQSSPGLSPTVAWPHLISIHAATSGLYLLEFLKVLSYSNHFFPLSLLLKIYSFCIILGKFYDWKEGSTFEQSANVKRNSWKL